MTDRPHKPRASSKAANGYPDPDEIMDRHVQKGLSRALAKKKAGIPAADPPPEDPKPAA